MFFGDFALVRTVLGVFLRYCRQHDLLEINVVRVGVVVSNGVVITRRVVSHRVYRLFSIILATRIAGVGLFNPISSSTRRDVNSIFIQRISNVTWGSLLRQPQMYPRPGRLHVIVTFRRVHLYVLGSPNGRQQGMTHVNCSHGQAIVVIRLMGLQLTHIVQGTRAFSIRVIRTRRTSTFRSIFLVRQSFTSLFTRHVPHTLVYMRIRPMAPNRSASSLAIVNILVHSRRAISIFWHPSSQIRRHFSFFAKGTNVSRGLIFFHFSMDRVPTTSTYRSTSFRLVFLLYRSGLPCLALVISSVATPMGTLVHQC